MPIINGQGRIGVRVSPTVYPSEFITVWKTDNTTNVAENNLVRLVGSAGDYNNCTVDWGDGSITTHVGSYITIQHTYASPGTYTIKISGRIDRLGINDADRKKLIQITNWGNLSTATYYRTFGSCTNLTITAMDTPQLSGCTNLGSMFINCTSLTTVPNLKNWNVSNITSFGDTYDGVFYGCTSLTSVDVSNWNLKTTGTISLAGMFYNCINLTTITGINNWNTSRVTRTDQMFYGCSKLQSLTLTNWNVSNLVNVVNMFTYCTSLTNIDFTGWGPNVNKITSTVSMFQNCTSLSGVTGFNGWDLSSCINTYDMFKSCTSIKNLDLSNWNLTKVTTIGGGEWTSTFYGMTNLETLNVSNWSLNTTQPINTYGLFNGLSKLNTITGIGTWNTSRFTSGGRMFMNCSSLTSLDLSTWDISNMTDLTYMFNGCTSLKDINLTGWGSKANKVTTALSMFQNSTSLSGTTGFDSWNLSACTTTLDMFSNCTSVKTLNLSNWNLSNATTIGGGEYQSMFRNMNKLETLNVSNWLLNTSGSVNLGGLFASCTKLNTITGINTWNTSKVTSTTRMFQNCTSLGTIDMSNLNFTSLTDATYMFYNMSMLTSSINVSGWTLNTTSNINMMGMFQSSGNLNVTGLNTWDVTKVNNFTNFMISSTLPTTEYSNMLAAWYALDLTNNLSFNGGSSKYNAAGQTARASIIANDVWTISDGGLQP